MNNFNRPQVIDLNIHGIIRLRLVDPSLNIVAKFLNKYGPILKPLDDQDPDIIVHFQEGFSSSDLRHIGLNSVGFTSEDFFILDNITGEIQARIPFEKIGDRCEIFCQRGLSSVPLLLDVIILTFLKKNYIPLHASAFIYNEVGVVVVGWPKGGKTGALLSFINHGARYVGEEWVFLTVDGQRVFGLPLPISVSEWQLEYIPDLMPNVSAQQQLLFKGVPVLDSIHSVLERTRLKKSYPAKLIKKSLPPLKRQLKIYKAPQTIFENHFGPLETSPDKIFLIMSHAEQEIRVEACAPAEIALRMALANVHEQREFFEYYQAFKFAFPYRKNDFLENVTDLQHSLLIQALNSKDTFQILHPYAGPLEPLYAAMQPFCGKPITKDSFLSDKTISLPLS